MVVGHHSNLMNMELKLNEHPITSWLRRTSSVNFTIYASIVSFSLYTCIYSLRKSFGVATYDGIAYWGVDYKGWMVISQVIGYLISKIIGIKVASELKSAYRAKGILLMVSIATVSWLFFAITPKPYNLVFLFTNGLPLGMVWSLVFSYLEGRKTTEVLGASLSVSFIFSAGLGKTIGGLVMRDWGITEFWMPLVTSGLFFIPLLVFLWLINKLPPPSLEDELLRTKRRPMTSQERLVFIKMFGPGLVLLILSYSLLTAFRDFRDNFSAEIWRSLDYYDKPSVFTQTETPISIIVLLIISTLILVKKNQKALLINHLMILIGMLMVGASTFAFERHLISPLAWMTLVGMGLYFGYIQFNSIFFDRLLASFRYSGTVAFLINLADSFGYLGSVGVILYKYFGQSQISWLSFFISGGYIVSFSGIILITISMIYFQRKHRILISE